MDPQTGVAADAPFDRTHQQEDTGADARSALADNDVTVLLLPAYLLALGGGPGPTGSVKGGRRAGTGTMLSSSAPVLGWVLVKRAACRSYAPGGLRSSQSTQSTG
jgi:hypothetical protein